MGLTCDLLTATIVLGPLDVLFARQAGNSCVTPPARRKPVEYEENGAKIAREPTRQETRLQQKGRLMNFLISYRSPDPRRN